ncbi:MAG: hypothetical protein QM662_14005, partial [Gordonia sp. (in: high G+C Gram-positive bacteria)]
MLERPLPTQRWRAEGTRGVLAGAWEILANRIAWTAALCVIVLTAGRDWAWLPPLLGVVVLRERLRPLQWCAVGIGAAAAIYLA